MRILALLFFLLTSTYAGAQEMKFVRLVPNMPTYDIPLNSNYLLLARNTGEPTIRNGIQPVIINEQRFYKLAPVNITNPLQVYLPSYTPQKPHWFLGAAYFALDMFYQFELQRNSQYLVR